MDLLTLRRRRRTSRQVGFTLVELAVVIMIVGILTLIGFPVFSEGQVGARRNSCVDRQHTVYEAALIYCAENHIPDGNLSVSVLQPTLLQPPATDCPTSLDGSHDDYTIVIQGGAPVDVVCNVQGDRHPWRPN